MWYTHKKNRAKEGIENLVTNSCETEENIARF